MISPEDTYPGRATPADANYPEGSIKNETIPNSSDDGTPLDELWGNDFEGLKQAIARSASIVPTIPGNVPDTATASQIIQGLIEMMQGRATNYDEGGAVNAYVLTARANQQKPANLFNDQEFYFVASVTNTLASTIDLLGLGGGVKNIINTSKAGTLVAGNRYGIRYRSGTDDVELIQALSKEFTSTEQTITAAGALIVAHDLPTLPSLVQVRLICKTAEFNYSIGDEIIIREVSKKQKDISRNITNFSERVRQ